MPSELSEVLSDVLRLRWMGVEVSLGLLRTIIGTFRESALLAPSELRCLRAEEGIAETPMLGMSSIDK